jgi:hypothetical protein
MEEETGGGWLGEVRRSIAAELAALSHWWNSPATELIKDGVRTLDSVAFQW